MVKDAKKNENSALKMDLLIEKINLLIGDRTLKQYCSMADIGYSYACRLLNGRLSSFPKQNTLAKMTSKEAAPQNGVTYEDLLKICGYIVDTSEMKRKPPMNFSFPLSLVLDTVVPQIGKIIDISMTSGMFKLKSEGYDKEIIVIPAFDYDRELDDIKKDVAKKLVLGISWETKESAQYIILTDNLATYEHFLNTYGDYLLSELEVYVAYTEDYIGFKKQNRIVPKDNKGIITQNTLTIKLV